METVIKANKNKTQRYKSYKDSGEEWIGGIPEHWEVRKLKHIFVEKKAKANMKLSCGAISFGKVVTKEDEKIPEATKASYQEVKKGEFLINPLNLNYDLISLRIALSYIDVVVSAGYIVLKACVDMDKGYFKYLLHRYDVAYMKLLGSGVRQTISFNHISSSLLLYPPKEEQTRIANFLDQKTAQIDQAIVQKERQIELLKERRQILIHNAVTRGLDSNVKMKDSSVEWIGEIPDHWEVKKLKHVSNFITSGPRGWSEFFSDDGAYFLQSGNLNDTLGIDLENAVRVKPKESAEGMRTKLQENDILIVVTGAKTGKVAIAKIGPDEVYINQHLCLVRLDMNINPAFLSIVLYSQIGRTYFYLQQYGLKKGLGLEDVKNAPIFLPLTTEQIEIVDYIETISTKIFAAISLKEQEVEKLKEYKSTLINTAVTGKIRVS
ncbi:MAG: restriction endonuclease subunit S [Flavipsychrobacter sp.]|nr:restriction endonuclease subunit S [Flavipsychrobacter sp.]